MRVVLVGAMLVALVCLVGLIGTALAQMQTEEYVDTNVDTTTELEVNETTIKQQMKRQVKVKEQSLQEKVQKRLHKLEVEKELIKARDNYKAAREEYMKLRQEGKVNFGHAKMYCLAGGVYIEKWFDRIESMILNSDMDNETKEAMLAKIEEKRITFEEKLRAVNESQTPEELRNAVKELKDEWKNIRVIVKAAVMQVVIVKIETIVEKAELLELKLEERINEVNNTELAAILEDYAAKLEEAKEKLEEAKKVLIDAETRENINEAQKLIRNAISILKDAFKDVREIVKFLMKPQEREGKVFFGYQTGELFVKGNGTARFEGTGIVVIRSTGEITVEPETAIITLVGFNKSVDNGVAMVSGEGKAVIRGKNISVVVTGDLKLFVKGYGTAYLEGEGVYRVKKLPGYNMTEEIEYSDGDSIKIGSE
jgi:hypothetical protein